MSGEYGNHFVGGSLKVGARADAHSSAALDVQSTTKGFLPPRMTQAQRDLIGSPQAGLIVFNTDTNQLNQYNGAAWVLLAGSGGSGKKNYIDNGTFENDTTGWSTYDDGSAYVDGTGGSPSGITISRTTSSPLAGTGSLLISKAAVDSVDEGVSVASETIDIEDRGAPQVIQMSYDFSDADYVSGDMQLKAYDVTNGAILSVFPIANLDDDCGLLKGAAKALAVCYPPSTCTQVRASLHMETDSATAAAWDGKIDSVLVGPDSAIPSIEFKSEVVTANGSFTGGTLLVTKLGNQVSIRALTDLTHASASAPSSSVGLIPEWARPSDITTNVYFANTTEVRRFIVNADGGIATGYFNYAGSLTNLTGSGPMVATSYPVQNTSSNLMSSFEASLQTLEFRASKTTSQTGINTNGSFVKIVLDKDSGSTRTHDNFNVFDTTNSRFVAPIPAKYDFDAKVYITGTNVLANLYILVLRINGNSSNDIYVGIAYPLANKPFLIGGPANNIHLNAGDYVEVFLYGDGNNSVNTMSTVPGDGLVYFAGRLNPNFSVFGAYSEAGETLEVTGTVTPTTTAFTVSAELPVPIGKWRIEHRFTASQNANVSTTGIFINLSNGTSTASAENINTNTRADLAINGTVGGLGTVIHEEVLTAPKSFYGKTSAYGANFNSAATYKLIATRIK